MIYLRKFTNGKLDITENYQEDEVSTTYCLLEEGEGGSNKVEAFGVELLQITIPYATYTLVNTELAGGTVPVCPLPFLDNITIPEIGGFGVKLISNTKGTFDSVDVDAYSEGEVIFVSMELSGGESYAICFVDGHAYLLGQNEESIQAGYELFLFTERPVQQDNS